MNVKYQLKFYGKLITYLAVVLTVEGVVNHNFVNTASGILFIISGCALHEFSE